MPISPDSDCVAGWVARTGPATGIGAHPFGLEPESLLRNFRAHPPKDFCVECAGDGVPVFATDYAMLTTATPAARALVQRLPGAAIWTRALTIQARFAGATVSEYFPLRAGVRPADLVASLKSRHAGRCGLLVLKDIPWGSPLLDAEANRLAVELLRAARSAGFTVMRGQALAYVPVDFRSLDEFLRRFSRTHRRDLRRKLRPNAGVAVSSVMTGDSLFDNAAFVDECYQLYVNVYQQSDVHFDLLTREFFESVLQEPASGGVVFIYRDGADMIGWNLCYVAGGNLVDKYVGFRYPEARRSNLYVVSWFNNLEYARSARLRHYVAGWTDPEIKAYLGARFTLTRHAVFLRNPMLRLGLRVLRRWLESDAEKVPDNLAPDVATLLP